MKLFTDRNFDDIIKHSKTIQRTTNDMFMDTGSKMKIYFATHKCEIDELFSIPKEKSKSANTADEIFVTLHQIEYTRIF